MSPIDQKAEQIREWIGEPLHDERPTFDGLGRYRTFMARDGMPASIHWHPRHGTYEVHGAIRRHWEALGCERGPLGFPTSDEHDLEDFGKTIGRINHFERGAIHWLSNTNACCAFPPNLEAPPPIVPKDYLETARKEIAAWEAQGPGFVSRVGDAVLWPAQRAAEAMVPASVQESATKAVHAILTNLGDVAQRTVPGNKLRETIAKRLTHLPDPANPSAELWARDKQARISWNVHVGLAAAEGAGTGAVGLPGLVADIPAFLTITLRQLQEMAVIYGFDPDAPEERDYLLHVLRTGGAGDRKYKLEYLLVLKQVEELLLRASLRNAAGQLAARELSKFSLVATLRQLAHTLAVQLTKRKALQMIPVIGAVVGGCFNAAFIHDVANAGYHCYRRRFLQNSGILPA
jgi:hypothetical protein